MKHDWVRTIHINNRPRFTSGYRCQACGADYTVNVNLKKHTEEYILPDTTPGAGPAQGIEATPSEFRAYRDGECPGKPEVSQ
jgi:hypothetical protein